MKIVFVNEFLGWVPFNWGRNSIYKLHPNVIQELMRIRKWKTKYEQITQAYTRHPAWYWDQYFDSQEVVGILKEGSKQQEVQDEGEGDAQVTVGGRYCGYDKISSRAD